MKTLSKPTGGRVPNFFSSKSKLAVPGMANSTARSSVPSRRRCKSKSGEKCQAGFLERGRGQARGDRRLCRGVRLNLVLAGGIACDGQDLRRARTRMHACERRAGTKKGSRMGRLLRFPSEIKSVSPPAAKTLARLITCSASKH